VVADVLASSAEQRLERGGTDRDIDTFLAAATERELQLHVVWGWVDGEAPAQLPALPEEARARLLDGKDATFRVDDPPAQWTLVPATSPEGRRFFVAVGESMVAERQHLLAGALTVVATIVLLSLLCSAAITLVGQRLIGQPIKRLVEHARRVAAGDLSGRLDLRQRDEIGVLASEMNT
jgi:HAMP domain-containing protein